jgi:hypothetical protein
MDIAEDGGEVIPLIDGGTEGLVDVTRISICY